jgi:phosphoglycerate dehydrogenase-like enzyme
VTDVLLISDGVEKHFGTAIENIAPGLKRVVIGSDAAQSDVADVTLAYFSGDVYPDRSADFLRAVIRAKGLRWFHTFSAGVDNAFFQGLLDRGIRLSTSSGAMAAPIAHTVMLYVLAFSRNLRGWMADQHERNWNPRNVRDLAGRTLGVVGLGPIGSEVARLASIFGMRVIGFRRNPSGSDPCETQPVTQLRRALGEMDYLVLAAPLTDETRGLIGADELSAMRSDAVLINIARGEMVDEVALIEALTQGQIGGAALDVFETEPLPAESPLWSLPNAIVTPHSSGTNPGNFFRATEIFVENLAHYLSDEPMRNEVTRGGDR